MLKVTLKEIRDEALLRALRGLWLEAFGKVLRSDPIRMIGLVLVELFAGEWSSRWRTIVTIPRAPSTSSEDVWTLLSRTSKTYPHRYVLRSPQPSKDPKFHGSS